MKYDNIDKLLERIEVGTRILYIHTETAGGGYESVRNSRIAKINPARNRFELEQKNWCGHPWIIWPEKILDILEDKELEKEEIKVGHTYLLYKDKHTEHASYFEAPITDIMGASGYSRYYCRMPGGWIEEILRSRILKEIKIPQIKFKIGDLSEYQLKVLLNRKIIPQYIHDPETNTYTAQIYPTDLGDFIDENEIRTGEELNERLGFDISKKIDDMILMMHEKDILHGDLHAKNIVLNPETKDVRFIDFVKCKKISTMTKDDMKRSLYFWDSSYISKEKMLKHERDMWKIGYL